ncbi:uncharacterized protein [Periplaneta americana]|uniref:uncharacterized protein n=1 Tax=Periplaneta americana TaxID=6978 RepID=UPI0037E90234
MLFLTSKVFISTQSILLTIQPLPPFLLEIITILILVILLALPVPITDRFLEVHASDSEEELLATEDEFGEESEISISESCYEREIRHLHRTRDSLHLEGKSNTAQAAEELQRRLSIRQLRLNINLGTPCIQFLFKEEPEPEDQQIGDSEQILRTENLEQILGEQEELQQPVQGRIIRESRNENGKMLKTDNEKLEYSPFAHAMGTLGSELSSGPRSVLRDETNVQKMTETEAKYDELELKYKKDPANALRQENTFLKQQNVVRRSSITNEIYSKRCKVDSSSKKNSLPPNLMGKTIVKTWTGMWKRLLALRRPLDKVKKRRWLREEELENRLSYRLKTTPAATNLRDQWLPPARYRAGVL